MSLLRRRTLMKTDLEPETSSALIRMSVYPSIIDILNYDLLIKELKDGHSLQRGVYNLNTVFRIFALNAAHDSQVSLINWSWSDGGFDGEFVGTIGFTQYRGTFSSSSSYIKRPLEVISDNLFLDCTMGSYHYTDNSSGAWGCGQSNGQWNAGFQRQGASSTAGRINSTSTALMSSHATGQPGIYAVKRQANQQTIWFNTTLKGTTNGSTSLGTIVATNGFGEHAFIRNGDVVGFHTDIKSCHFYGRFNTNLGVIKTAIENYLAKYP